MGTVENHLTSERLKLDRHMNKGGESFKNALLTSWWNEKEDESSPASTEQLTSNSSGLERRIINLVNNIRGNFA